MRHLSTTLAIAACAIGLSLPAQATETHQEKLVTLARELATNLSRACPHSANDNHDTEAFKSCAEVLKTATFLPFAHDMMWGGDQANLPMKKRHLTHLNPTVFQSMYLPLITFTGKWSVVHDDRANLDVIKLEAFFRNELPAGEYPYPFWHSAAKWNAYETMNQVNFYLNDKGEIFVGTRGDTGSNNARGQYSHVAHETFEKDHWQWTDANGKAQPEVTLFSARYAADNPHLPRLDQTYRAFAMEMREGSCTGCHNPANPADATTLTLLQTPAHAAAEIDRVIDQVEKGEMPQDDIGLRKEIDPKLRAAILRTAVAFRDELAAANEWELKARADSTPPTASVQGPNSVTC